MSDLPLPRRPDGRVLHLLVADDSAINRTLAQHALQRLGASADLVADGLAAVEALEAAPAGHYDLVLMDLEMPGLDGLEATRRIRDAEAVRAAGHRTPVVALTAALEEEDRRRCAEAGMDAHLPKPIALRTLREVVLGQLASIPVPRRADGPGVVLDLDRLDEVTEQFGGDDAVAELIGLYVAELPGRLGRLQAAAEAADLDTVREVAYQLAGASEVVGVVVGPLCRMLEADCRRLDADVAAVAAQVRGVGRLQAPVVAALQQWVAERR